MPQLLAAADATDPLRIEMSGGPAQENIIAKAITEAADKIATAMEANARAVREQGKTLERVVGELTRMERRMAAWGRKGPSAPTRSGTREVRPRSRSPAVKSVIKIL